VSELALEIANFGNREVVKALLVPFQIDVQTREKLDVPKSRFRLISDRKTQGASLPNECPKVTLPIDARLLLWESGGAAKLRNVGQGGANP
jgi:hypothetical protein